MTDQESIDLNETSVLIGMPVAPKSGVPPKTVMSLMAVGRDLERAKIDYGVSMRISGIVMVGRDMVLDDFLSGDKQKLFWIDSDMVFAPGDFFRLLALSQRMDVVCATYPAKVETPNKFFVNREPNKVSRNKYGCLSIKGTGLGFTIVDRKVVEALAAKAPIALDQVTGKKMASVFRVDITPEGNRRTEDFAFFSDIRDLGYEVWLDPSIDLGHIGEREWRGSIMETYEDPPASQAAE